MEAQQNHAGRRQTKFPYPKLVSPEINGSPNDEIDLTSPGVQNRQREQGVENIQSKNQNEAAEQPRSVTVRVTAPLPVCLSPKGFPAAIESEPTQARSGACPPVFQSPFVSTFQVKTSLSESLWEEKETKRLA